MRQYTESEMEEISLRFKAIYEYQEKIEAHKEEVKLFSSGMRETFKALAEKLEVKQKILKKAYKQYLDSIQNPEDQEELNDILAMLIEQMDQK